MHVQHLLSPGIHNSSFACSITASAASPQLPRYDPPAFQGNNFFTSRTLFIPAFTVDQITVGVGVAEDILGPGDIWVPKNLVPSAPHCVNFRFLKADHSKLFFVVYDDPEDNLVLFHYTKPITTCEYSSFTGLFRRELLSTINAGSVTPECLRQALVFYQDSSFIRSCPMCGAGPQDKCGCSLPLLAPVHPFDGQYFSRGMAMHLGNFDTIANKVLFVGRKQVKQVVMGSRLSLSKLDDSSLVQRLSAWSVSEFMKRSVEPPSYDVNLSVYGISILDELQARSRERPCSEDDFNFAQNEDMLLIRGDEEERTLTSLECNTADSVDGTNPDENPDQCLKEISTDVHNTQLESVFGSFLKSEACPRKPDSIPSSLDLENKSLEISETMDPKEMVRQIKAERRKERNRASARRSNQKRKERRLVISHEIDGLLERLESLREKELSLRKDNLRLRKMVGDFR